MKPGTIKNDELWIRCPYCGDSSDHWKCHFRIQLKTGLFHCHRCGEGGKLDAAKIFQLNLMKFRELDPLILEKQTFSLGPGTKRKSLLQRYHTPDNVDAFKLWWTGSPEAIHVGWDVRGKQKHTVGIKGIAWIDTPRPLTSTPSDPLTLVEGPYDVVKPRDVCLSGFFNSEALRQLKGQLFYLCPDGDIWTNQELFIGFYNRVIKILRSNLYSVLGIIFLPGNKDPDESSERPILSTEEFLSYGSRQTH